MLACGFRSVRLQLLEAAVEEGRGEILEDRRNRRQALARGYGEGDGAPRLMAKGYGEVAERSIAEAQRLGGTSMTCRSWSVC